MNGRPTDDELPGEYLVTPAAAVTLETVEREAADLFARHLSGDWGGVFPEIAQLNESPAAARRMSCYWYDQAGTKGFVVLEQDDALTLWTTEELTGHDVMLDKTPWS